MKVKFAVLGDAFVDVVAGTLVHERLPQWGTGVECTQPIQLQPGGSALNTATHLANLSNRNPTHELHVTLHTAIGSDSFAEMLKAHLAEHKVVLSSPKLENASTGVCIVLSGANDRSFITHYGAVRNFCVEDINEEMVLSADHVHIGGFYSCVSLRKKLKPLLEKARKNGITTSLDTNYDSLKKWDDLEELYPLIDVLLPNEVEAMKISHTESVEAAMAYFAKHVNGLTIIKVQEIHSTLDFCQRGRQMVEMWAMHCGGVVERLR
ncbi:unnamed protein product [Peronospora belbahrii]|uniref:Adenosine kinase n=1 Tax=Peronospora belbahrii TaxID=622444 RepID=A0ABN8D629_9STRA|nr:unnamed protein product [Peronospora belbahrii]